MNFTNFQTVDLLVTILFGRQFKDTHVCHGQSSGSSSERDFDQLKVRHEGKFAFLDFVTPLLIALGTQHAYWDCEKIDEDSRAEY
jgi:hypothetical protein